MTEQEHADHLPARLSLLAANERAIATLYEEYAARFPAQSDFWSGLADDEKQHATWLEELGLPDATSPGTSPSRFAPEAIETFTSYVREQTNEVRAGHVSPAVALTTAYFIETALMERRFFEQLAPDIGPVGAVMSRLVRSTAEHVNKVKDASRQGRSGGL